MLFFRVVGQSSSIPRLKLAIVPVNRVQAEGKPRVSEYFGNYDKLGGWQLAPGLVDGRPALLALDPDDRRGPPLYFLLLEWNSEQVISIRDFRYARYALEGAQIVVLDRS